MRKCKKCGKKVPYKVVIDGRSRNLKNRKFCLECSPFKQHNTRDITKRKREKWEYRSERRRRLKLELIQYKGGHCELCGYDKPIPRAYAFHHEDPDTKEIDLATDSVSWEKMKQEADKCRLLCCRCHMEVHHELYLARKLPGEQMPVKH